MQYGTKLQKKLEKLLRILFKSWNNCKCFYILHKQCVNIYSFTAKIPSETLSVSPDLF